MKFVCTWRRTFNKRLFITRINDGYGNTEKTGYVIRTINIFVWIWKRLYEITFKTYLCQILYHSIWNQQALLFGNSLFRFTLSIHSGIYILFFYHNIGKLSSALVQFLHCITFTLHREVRLIKKRKKR